jgi:hypothetical protein
MNGLARTTAFVGAMVALTGVSAKRWRDALPPVATAAPAIPSITVGSDSALDDSLASAVDLVVSNDPFRVSNTPPSVRFDARSDGNAAGAVGQTVIVRPMLALKGVVGGPPWQAMIDGIPGQSSGTMVRDGARYDKLLVRSVTRDSVVIQGFDTTWVLTFRRP